ncbi:hypothetical protein [Endozoicomonas sp. SCSIO W0465]|uniref:hypothetical protein n=1 Tax=Endozoicomonas sp. SCSIO W0465 TaxID=2918516 RepID=UPI002074B863|nr:hypothetical protein [Endozoicomonas sp. SCSIO W0465]USE38321.1 hypothetical protein MJO57_09225 [Endozoicomonas sp. SCSIO W0465]
MELLVSFRKKLAEFPTGNRDSEVPFLTDPCGTSVAAMGMDFSADDFRGCFRRFLVSRWVF